MFRTGGQSPRCRSPSPAMRSIKADSGLHAIFTAFGGDDHHAVSAAGTVDSGGARVFQHFNAFNISRVDVCDGRGSPAAGAYSLQTGVVDENTIYYVQRIITGIDRGGAAHAD